MQEADVVVRVQGLVRLDCAHGHTGVGPADVGSRLVAEVRTMLLVAERRGVLRRREVCGHCGVELTLLPRHTDTPVPTDLDGRVVTTMARCPACGLEQLGPDTADRVDRVLQAAVRGAAG